MRTATPVVDEPQLHGQDRAIPALVESGRVTPAQVERAVRAREEEGGLRGILFYLIDAGAVASEDAAAALASEFGQAPIDLRNATPPDPRVLALIPASLARELRVAPIAQHGPTLQVAMRDTFDTDALARLRGHARTDVQPVLADEHSLWFFLDLCYPSDQLARTAGLAIAAVSRDEDVLGARRDDAVREKVHEAAVPAFVREVLRDAVRRRASDVHFEVYDDFTRVRYRVDGRLVEARRDEDPRVAGHIAGHIKYLASLRSASDRMPQDGALTLEVDGRDVQFRVGTVPTVSGEKVVLRILDYTDVPTNLSELGLDGREHEIVHRSMRAKRGMLLVTGPTGSGKSTTLAAILTKLNRPEVNILTVEDPVERRIQESSRSRSSPTKPIQGSTEASLPCCERSFGRTRT